MSTREAAYPNKQQSFASPPLSIVLAIILLIFFILCFFSLFFCRCLFRNLMQALNRQRGASRNVANSANDPAVNPGLDQKMIQSYPCFPYSHVKDSDPERYGLECSICISEFSDDDILRLLTDCYHAFHKDCVDLWLESHKTCPLCRSLLNPNPNSLENGQVPAGAGHGRNRSHEYLQDAVSIFIGEQNSIHEEPNTTESSNTSMNQVCENEEQQRSFLNRIFSRSNSTGHTLVSDRVEDEKDDYLLRLPEHVMQKITRCHNHTKSCITFGELTRPQASNGDFLGETSVAKTKRKYELSSKISVPDHHFFPGFDDS